MDTMEDFGFRQVDDIIGFWEHTQALRSLYENSHSSPFHYNLYLEIVKCRKTGVPSEKLGEMFVSMSKAIVARYNIPERLKDDAICSGAMSACYHWTNYNPEKSYNAFAYINQVIRSGFAGYIHKEAQNEEKTTPIAILLQAGTI